MNTKGLEALERVLESSDRFARHQAVLMLQEAGLVDSRVGRLASADETERERARQFVERLIHAGQLDRLRGLAAEHSDEAVRSALAAMLPAEGDEREEHP
jgi:hypothetical protein